MATTIKLEGTDTYFLTGDNSTYDDILADYQNALMDFNINDMFQKKFPDYDKSSLDTMISQLSDQAETIGENSGEYVPPTATQLGGTGDYTQNLADYKEANYETTVNEDGSVTQTRKADSPSAATRAYDGLSTFADFKSTLQGSPKGLAGLVSAGIGALSDQKSLADTIDEVSAEYTTDLGTLSENLDTLEDVDTGWMSYAKDVLNGAFGVATQNYAAAPTAVASWASKNEVEQAKGLAQANYLNEVSKQYAADKANADPLDGVLGYGAYSDTSGYGSFDFSDFSDFNDFGGSSADTGTSFGVSDEALGSFDFNAGYSGWDGADSSSDSSSSSSNSNGSGDSDDSGDDPESSASSSSGGFGGDQNDRQ